MFYFSASKNAFYDNALQARYLATGTWPEDCLEASDELYENFSSQPPAGKQRGVGSNGLPVWVDFESVDSFIILGFVKGEIRVLRDKFLSRVADIGAAAFVNGNTSLANEVFLEPEGVRRKLLDITDDPALNAATTREDMEAAVLAYYAEIVANVSPELRGAFKELDA